MRRLANKPNALPPDSDYPFGKNVDKTQTTPGTKLDEEMFGDAMQFFEKMFDDSGLTANDLPDNAYSGFQLFQAFLISFQKNLLVKNSIEKDSGDDNKINLVGDQENPDIMAFYSVDKDGVKGWNRPITGSVEVDSSYFRFANWSDYTFTFDSPNSQNKTINYWVIGNIMTLNFALNLTFDVTGTNPSDTGDIYIKFPPIFGDYTVRIDENFSARIADDTPSTTPDFVISGELIDTQTSQGCNLDEVHFTATLTTSGANKTIVLRGQIGIILDI